jgi:alanyl-tRNA synthetase
MEKERFSETLERGITECMKMKNMDLKSAFLLYQSYGLPYDVIKEFAPNINQKDFEEELKKHQELSRKASAGMFKGGLADHEPATIKLHTAHHLLLAALQEMFGKQVKQRGSNINQERLRIDFSFDRKLTDEEKKKLEDMVNEKIGQRLNVIKREIPLEEAQKIGAEMEFGVKYSNKVSVYFIEDKKGNVFSKEFCGGPHVAGTGELGRFKIIKEEAVSSGVRRIKAILE